VVGEDGAEGVLEGLKEKWLRCGEENGLVPVVRVRVVEEEEPVLDGSNGKGAGDRGLGRGGGF